ncbi:MAG: serine/threonine protein kinase [Leptolyngbyaceae cyanobacterium CRU_2_3]|nr:serine/threonine protein kinase [Leptolyngbyaceae cyanobacterium CRU_2_3]
MSQRSNYRLLGLVGQGQFGQVFCAVSRQTGRLAALKRLDHQRFPTHKFLRELRFLLSLRHPNIVACQALEHTDISRHLVMDYCEGGTLRSLMTEENRLTLPQSVKLVADILAGLGHAHSRNIIHCDIKPENILLTVQPWGWTAKISDFGTARLNRKTIDRETGNTGSPAYMAPERFYGEFSPTSDLYAVGVLLFELLAGHRPFSGTPTEIRSAHLHCPVEIPDSIPECWRPLILTALQKLSARRFQSAQEMLEALRSIATLEQPKRQTTLPLLIPTEAPPECVFQVLHQQTLDQPIVALALSNKGLYQANAQGVSYQGYTEPLLQSGLVAAVPRSIALEAPAKSLVWRSQGCFVLTRRSVHLIPAVSSQEDLGGSPILFWNQDRVIAISPEGDWLATLYMNGPTYWLTFLPLSHRALGLAVYPVQVSSEVQVEVQAAFPQLFALDARHVAIVMTLPSDAASESQSEGRTLIKVFTRRGSYVGSLFLPLRLGQAILTSIPYQILAIDRDNPHLIVRIDLKPYRLTRLSTGIVSTLLSSTDWGYILANSQGQIMLLDLAGRQVGKLMAPAGITAIAPLTNVAYSWQRGQSSRANCIRWI